MLSSRPDKGTAGERVSLTGQFRRSPMVLAACNSSPKDSRLRWSICWLVRERQRSAGAKGPVTGEPAGALPERRGGDVMHQLGEGQRVGGGPAAAANRLQTETKQVRGAVSPTLPAVEEQLSSQRDGHGHLEVTEMTRGGVRLHPHTDSKGELTVSRPNISIQPDGRSQDRSSAE